MTQTDRRRREQVSDIGAKVPATGIGHWFTRMASTVANIVGSPWAFLGAAASIFVWALTGPLFNFSSDWQLWVNTGTTVITFLMVFLIQNAQNRDAKAIHLDLDEIVREKQIVDRADPVPPAHKGEERQAPKVPSGNGKTRH